MGEAKPGHNVSATAVHPVDERVRARKAIPLGIQHVLVMYAGAIAVPFVMGNALGLSDSDIAYLVSADLFLCGVGTLLQCFRLGPFGIRLPVMMGAAFSTVPAAIVIGQTQGILVMYGSIMVGGLIMIGLSPLLRYILRFFPPVVTGSVITIIGLSLVPAGINMISGDSSSAEYGSLREIGVAAATLLLFVLMYRFLPRSVREVALLITLVAATVVAIIVGYAMVPDLADTAVFKFPRPFHFGIPQFDVFAILTFSVSMLVVIVECAGQCLAVGEVVERDLTAKDVARGVRADGLATALNGILQAFPYTVYAQNIGMLSLTGIKSRYVVGIAGGFLIVLGVVPVVGELVTAIPGAVLGVVSLVLFAMVAVAGVRMLAGVDFSQARNLVIASVSLGVGLVPVMAPEFYQHFPDEVAPVLHSGVAACAIVAILLNLLFSLGENRPKRRLDDENTAAA